MDDDTTLTKGGATGAAARKNAEDGPSVVSSPSKKKRRVLLPVEASDEAKKEPSCGSRNADGVKGEPSSSSSSEKGVFFPPDVPLGELKKIVRFRLCCGGLLPWVQVPEPLRSDPEFLVETLQKLSRERKMLLIDWNHLPNEIKSDKAVAVAVMKTLMYDSTMNEMVEIQWNKLPTAIRADPQVLRCAIRNKRLEWAEVPAPFCSDPRYVVEAFRSGCRVDWNQLPIELRSDKEVAIAALREGTWWDAVNHQTVQIEWGHLPPAIKSHPEVILRALRLKRMEWSDVPNRIIQTDESVALLGLQRGYVTADDCACLQDPDTLEDLILDGYLVRWQEVPAPFRNDIQFARSVSSIIARISMLEGIFEQFPMLCRDRRFWIDMLEGFDEFGKSFDVSELIENCAPAEIRSDPTIMKMAVIKDFGYDCFIYHIDPSLKSRRDFMEPVLEAKPNFLFRLSRQNMENFPELVKATLSRFAEEDSNETRSVLFAEETNAPHSVFNNETVAEFAEEVPTQCWQDRSFVMEWLYAGFPFIATHSDGTNFFPSEWRNDKQLFLLLAEKTGRRPSRVTLSRVNFGSFGCAAPHLFFDKNFMLELVKHDPSLLHCAPIHLQQDFDLALLAFSSKKYHLVQHYFEKLDYETYQGQRKFALEFLASIKALPKMRKIFQRSVLPLINSTDQSSALSILNQGTETSAGFLQLLKDFLVPSEKQIGMMRRACRTLPKVLRTRKIPSVHIHDDVDSCLGWPSSLCGFKAVSY